MSTPHSLHQSVQSVLEHYFATLDGEIPSNLHAIMTQEMERGLLDFVMRRTGHNQSMSARWLGINRNTLNKKLKQYGITPPLLEISSSGEAPHA